MLDMKAMAFEGLSIPVKSNTFMPTCYKERAFSQEGEEFLFHGRVGR